MSTKLVHINLLSFIMQLTRASEYALRALLYLVEHDGEKPCSLKQIALKEKISPKFLSKILKKLSEQEIISIQLGKYGGYSLAKKPSEISMLTVIEAIEGKIAINKCLSQVTNCCRSKSCVMYKVWQRAQSKFMDELRIATLDQLI